MWCSTAFNTLTYAHKIFQWHRIYRSLRTFSNDAVHETKTVAVAMSGGVDSTAAALLLLDQGYKVVGVHMKNWDVADEYDGTVSESMSHTCTNTTDWKDVKHVCQQLQIPAVQVDLTREYWNDVFIPFLEAYESGKETPNPDVSCNRFVKFHHLRSFIRSKLGIEYLASGHYCRITSMDHSDSFYLRTGLDHYKDQSYFLSLTKREALQNVMFPIGHLQKKQVISLVSERLPGSPVLMKKESMGICFIGKRDMTDFLGHYIKLTPGRFIDWDTGEVVGFHKGQEYFTIGQKAKISGSVRGKYYVAGKYGMHSFSEAAALRVDSVLGFAERGDVFVVCGAAHPLLFTKTLKIPATAMNWITNPFEMEDYDRKERLKIRAACKTRYNQPPSPCIVHLQQDANQGSILIIEFDQQERAVTPGQILVLYGDASGDSICYGGAVISSHQN